MKTPHSWNRLLSLALCLCMVLSMISGIPLTAWGASGDSYELVTDVSQVLSGGQFVIVANKSGSAMALDTSISSKISAVAVTLSGNTVTGSNLPVWTVKATGSGISLNNGSKYLSYSSSTNFSSASSAYEWSVSAGKNGGFILNSASAARGIYYQISGSRFGAYATTNVSSSSYISELQLYKLASGGGSITVYFQNNWMWSDVTLHFWGSAGTADTQWPGKSMTLLGNNGSYDIYSLEIPSDITGLIINGNKSDNSGRDQTPDITSGWYNGIVYSMHWDNGNQVLTDDISNVGLPCSHKAETVPGKAPTCTETGLTEGSKCSLCGVTLKAQDTLPAAGHSFSGETCKTCGSARYTTVYFRNNWKWSNVRLYFWGSTSDAEPTWPGNAAEYYGFDGEYDIYTMKVPNDATGFLVNGDKDDGSGLDKTPDITEGWFDGILYSMVYDNGNQVTTGKISDVGLQCAHKAQTVPGKAPTCTATGLTEGSKCSLCGITLKAQESIPATGHTKQTVPGKAATCTATGLTDGVKCSVCGTVITAQKTIPTLPHSEQTIPGKAATCTATGLTEGSKCKTCGKVVKAQETIPTIPHSYKTDTCQVCGNPRYTTVYFRNNWKWSNVRLYYWESTSDAEALWPGKAAEYYGFDGEYDIYTMKVPNDATGFLVNGDKDDGSGLDKTPDITSGWFDGILYSMTWDNGNQVTTGKISDVGLQCPHQAQTLPGKAPTCTETGLTEGSKCSLCGATLKAQETIPATGHKLSNDKCTICGYARYSTVYFRNNWKWSNVRLYYWESTTDAEALWPGKDAQYYGFDGEYDIYVMQVPNDATGFLINGDKEDGSGLDKTPDIREGWFDGILYSMVYDNGNQVTTGNISDVGLKCPHKEQTIPAKAATCTESGLTEGTKCSLCGEILKAQQTVPATGHSKKTIAGKAPTCTEEGLSEGSKCKTCGEILKKQTVIPATGHTYSGDTCKVCGHVRYMNVYFRNNWLWTNIKLHFWGSDSDTNPEWPGAEMKYYGFDGTYEIYTMKVPTDIGGMTFTGLMNGSSDMDQSPDITEGWFDGVLYSMEWDNGNKVSAGKIGDISLECPHTPETIPGKAPTCTAEGLTEGSKCTTCGATLTAQKPIPATGHSYSGDSDTCSVCDAPRYTTVYFRNNWMWTNVRLYFWGSTSDAEPIWPGKSAQYYGFDGDYDIYTMKVPNDATGIVITGNHAETSELDKTPDINGGWFDGILYSMAYDNGNQVTTGNISDVGLQCPHKEQVIPAKAPTCTKDGLTEGTKCSLCGEILKAQETVPATGHSSKTLAAKAPTCTEDGLTKGSICKTCGEILKAQTVVPATGHSYTNDICKTCGTARYTTVYFRNNWKWSNVCLYYWGSTSDAEALWPGKAAEYYGFDGEYDIYVMKVPNDALGFLVNGDKDDGSGLDKTPDITEGWFDGILYSMAYDNGNQVTIGKISDVGFQCPHKEQTVPAKAPTCTETGLTEGTKCSLCGIVMKAQETVPATGHTKQTIPGKAATCTEEGLSEGSKCKTCGEILKKQTTLPATGHNFSGDTCKVCGSSKYVNIYFRNNWVWTTVKIHYWGSIYDINPSWPGYAMEYYGYDGSYDIYTMKIPVDVDGLIINGNKADGSGLDQTPDITSGWFDGILYSMNWDNGNQVTTGKITDIGLQCSHVEKIIPGKEPTCTEAGLSEGTVCSRCGETLTAQKTIPATGHSYNDDRCENCGIARYMNVYFRNNWLWTSITLHYWGSTSDGDTDWPGTAMTRFGYDGNYDIYVLKVPTDITGMIITGYKNDGSGSDQTPGLTGNWFDGIVYSMAYDNGNQVTVGKISDIGLQCPHKAEVIPAKAPTCTATGLTEGSKCSLCGVIMTPQQSVPATGHKEKSIPGKEATCTQEGLTDGVQCTVCKKVLVSQVPTPATGHRFSGTVCDLCGISGFNTLYFRNNWMWNDITLYYWGSSIQKDPEWPGYSMEYYGFDGEYDIYTMKVPVDIDGMIFSGSMDDGSGRDQSCDIWEGWFNGALFSMVWDNGNQVTIGKISDVGLQCPHETLITPGKAPTCTEAGYTESTSCTICGAVLVPQEVIPATGHTYIGDTCDQCGIARYMHIYFRNNWSWTNVRLHFWGSTSDSNPQWPGTAMTRFGYDGEYDIYVLKVPTDITGMLITGNKDDGSGLDQTPDLTGDWFDGIVYSMTWKDGNQVTTGKISDIGLKCPHNPETIPAKAPTCTKDGATEGSKCSLCGEILTEQEIIPATGHTEELLPTKAATCTETGLTVGKKCSTCNTVLVAQKPIPATGHRYNGTTCEVCGATGYYTIYFQNNWLWTGINIYYWGSSINEPEWPGFPMEYYGFDGKYDIYTMKIPVDIEGMIFNGTLEDGSGQDQSNDIWEGWYNGALFSMVWDNGNHVNIGKIGDINLQCNHVEQILPGKDATCTEDGLTQGVKCTRCGKTLTEQKVISATGHSFSGDSCENCGMTKYMHIYFRNNWLWTDISLHFWGSSFESDTQWPGNAMTRFGYDGEYDIYVLKVPTDITGMIISGNSGSGLDQTPDLTLGWFDGIVYFMNWEGGNQVSTGKIEDLNIQCPHTAETVPGKAPTCDAPGLTQGSKCTLCGVTLTPQQTIPATGHTVVTIPGKAATCTEDGMSDGSKCSTCGKVLITQEKLPATGHRYNGTTCELCGTSGYITIYFQNNWLWSDISLYYWGSSLQSDPSWPGISMEYYKNDGTYDIYSLAVPGDIQGLIFSGNTDDGSGRDQSCDIMEGWFDGALYSMVWDNGNHVIVNDINGNNKPGKELAFSGAGLTLYDDLTITFKADQSVIDLYTDVYAVFVLDGKTTVVRDFTLKDGKYSFPFRNIAPYRMNDTVTATLHGTFNGVEYTSETAQYSVATYCYNMLSKYSANSYAKFRTLLVDLLNYGAASQKYVGYNTGALVNANLTATQKAWATTTNRAWTSVQDLAYSTITSPSVQWKGGGLVLKESISMRFKISTSSIDGLKVKVVTKDGSEFIIDSFEPTNDGNYYFYFRELNAAQMSEAVTLTVYKGNTPVSNTVRYSIESYAYSQQNGSNTALVQLLQAMMKYGDAARSYVGK